MSDFEIKRSITEEDIPPTRSHVKSKWQGILDSMNTLEIDEGIEVIVPANHIRNQVEKLAKSRMPRKHFSFTGRSKKDGHHLYIIRKSKAEEL